MDYRRNPPIYGQSPVYGPLAWTPCQPRTLVRLETGVGELQVLL